jgi:hypothetical protein
MARAEIEAPKVRAGKKEDLFAALAAVDGVRSVREDEAGERLEIEYDETIVGENKLIEVAREHHVEGESPEVGTPVGTPPVQGRGP